MVKLPQLLKTLVADLEVHSLKLYKYKIKDSLKQFTMEVLGKQQQMSTHEVFCMVGSVRHEPV